MNRDKLTLKRCRRCNQPAGDDLICQNCKCELLSNYEASSDWQTAYEIEKASQSAMRYHHDETGDDENFF